ncbi:hypothetical protein V1478_004174 [Vespula squamosa]|uniref:Uncharacterized protein n=1 Tax=Vespula squamosa TaxID=30214 RepID=A0ABD2BK19_VESSQ
MLILKTNALILFHTIAPMEKLLKMYITKAELKSMDMSLTISYGGMKIFLLKYRERLRLIYLVIAFGAMLTLLKVKRSYSVYTC